MMCKKKYDRSYVIQENSVQHSPEESAPLLKTEPVIPNPINSKFKSTPLEQGSVSPSI